MRDTIQVVAHVRPVSDLCSRLVDAERHVGGARTHRAKEGGITVNGASQERQLGWKPEPIQLP